MKPSSLIGGTAIAAAIVAGCIYALQSFDAQAVACEDIASARASLQATYDAGVNASVQVYADEKASIDAELSRCLGASPKDPCADLQAARDAAVANYNSIQSPKDDASYAEFQTYFAKREEAYQAYKKAKDALDACRSANPPKGPVPYEESDTKKCFDAYDSGLESIRNTFTENTQALRSALTAAMAALDAREKACNPPTGAEQFTDLQVNGGASGGQSDGEATVSENILNCRPINPDLDSELFQLRKRAAAIPGEIQAVEESIKNVKERMSPLNRDLAEVDTYIPPESTKTQFEGALNALRAERKVAIEQALEFYRNMLARREAEKAQLEAELRDVNARIAARLAEIQRENAARQLAFPTFLNLAGPDECEYYHCHGYLCGKPDPAQNGCGHGSTTQDDVGCKKFFDAYLKAAGGN